jgi:hypothetical protein
MRLERYIVKEQKISDEVPENTFSLLFEDKGLIKNDIKIEDLIKSIPKKYMKGLTIGLTKNTFNRGEAIYHMGHIDFLKDELEYFRLNSWKSKKFLEENPKAWYKMETNNQYGIDKEGDYQREHLRNVMAHEVGHHVWHELMNDKDRDRLVKSVDFKKYNSYTTRAYGDFYKDRIEGEPERGNFFAMKNAGEKAAEMFREFIINKRYSKYFISIGGK